MPYIPDAVVNWWESKRQQYEAGVEAARVQGPRNPFRIEPMPPKHPLDSMIERASKRFADTISKPGTQSNLDMESGASKVMTFVKDAIMPTDNEGQLMTDPGGALHAVVPSVMKMARRAGVAKALDQLETSKSVVVKNASGAGRWPSIVDNAGNAVHPRQGPQLPKVSVSKRITSQLSDHISVRDVDYHTTSLDKAGSILDSGAIGNKFELDRAAQRSADPDIESHFYSKTGKLSDNVEPTIAGVSTMRQLKIKQSIPSDVIFSLRNDALRNVPRRGYAEREYPKMQEVADYINYSHLAPGATPNVKANTGYEFENRTFNQKIPLNKQTAGPIYLNLENIQNSVGPSYQAGAPYKQSIQNILDHAAKLEQPVIGLRREDYQQFKRGVNKMNLIPRTALESGRVGKPIRSLEDVLGAGANDSLPSPFVPTTKQDLEKMQLTIGHYDGNTINSKSPSAATNAMSHEQAMDYLKLKASTGDKQAENMLKGVEWADYYPMPNGEVLEWGSKHPSSKPTGKMLGPDDTFEDADINPFIIDKPTNTLDTILLKFKDLLGKK